MDFKHINERSEYASGMTVAVFSVMIVLTAVLACTLVMILTLPAAKAPLPEGTSVVSENETAGESGSTSQPGTPAVPVFSFSPLTVLPAATDATKTVGGEIVSQYAALVDVETGEILAGKNADVRFDPASLTKVMTLIVACERLTTADLEKNVRLTEDVASYISTGRYAGVERFGFDVDDETSVLSLLYGIGIKSAADCTLMLVHYMCDGEETFVGWMNEEATAMGLTNTHFDNAAGVEGTDHFSTASDMAAILMRALECPLIREILSSTHYTFRYSGYNSQQIWVTLNGTYYSTLFGDGRMAAYKKEYGTFKLDTADFLGGKTGSLKDTSWIYSLASFAVSRSSGKLYVLVTGNCTGTKAGANVMKDAKTLYDTYVK